MESKKSEMRKLIVWCLLEVKIHAHKPTALPPPDLLLNTLKDERQNDFGLWTSARLLNIFEIIFT